jgi:hypothetical protein
MTGNDYILLGVLFVFGFALVNIGLSKIDRHRSKQNTGDKGAETTAGVSEADPGSHRKQFSDHQNYGPDRGSGSQNGNSRHSANTLKRSAGSESSGTIEGSQDNSPGSQWERPSREQPSESGDVQRAAPREAKARDAAAKVMEELLQSSGALLQGVHRMKLDDVGVLLSTMSNKLKEEVDGGWEPDPLDEAGFETALGDFMESGEEFADGSSEDLIPWEQRSEEYQKFLQRFAHFLNVCTLGRMTVAGVSHREAATILSERNNNLLKVY